MIDRELYLPRSWTNDDRRCAVDGVPDDIDLLTKPALATGMLIRALNADVVARWVAGDEVNGADPCLRAELETRRVGYVLAIGCDRRVPTAAGRSAPTPSPLACPDRRGNGFPPAPGRRANASTTGR
jgi:SRSO17 transposase